MIEIYDDQNGLVESLHIWRIDQNYFRLDVAFDGTPKSLETWQKETNASLVVNGGYYSIDKERYFADGLTISNGETTGRSFTGFGGMLAISHRITSYNVCYTKLLRVLFMATKPTGSAGHVQVDNTPRDHRFACGIREKSRQSCRS